MKKQRGAKFPETKQRAARRSENEASVNTAKHSKAPRKVIGKYNATRREKNAKQSRGAPVTAQI